jgi:hypothetical protein
MDFKYAGKVTALTRNNDKTSAIDCGGYRSTFNMILSPRVGFLASHDRHGVYLGRRTSEKRWRWREGNNDDDITQVAPGVYVWAKLAWGRCTQAYIGVWEE